MISGDFRLDNIMMAEVQKNSPSKKSLDTLFPFPGIGKFGLTSLYDHETLLEKCKKFLGEDYFIEHINTDFKNYQK